MMRSLRLFSVTIWWVSKSLVQGQPPDSDKWDQACRDATQRADSYCMFYKVGSGAVCHGSHPPIPCGPANTSNIPTPPIPAVDECALLDPARGQTVREHLADDTKRDHIWAKAEDVNKCLNSLTITNFNALFTLHNLKYGLTETYAFTDVANGLNKSIQSNTCGFKLHSLDVDIKGFIDDKIREFADVLDPMTPAERRKFFSESIPAAPFHFALQREFSRLNDAHTLYFSPFIDFYYVLPIRFESRMRDGAQVITLGFPDLDESYYCLIYGTPVTKHKEGDVIVEVDGKPVLQWMQDAVSESGPYLGIYQGPLQRLSNHFFVSPAVDRDLRRFQPPTGPLSVTFQDGSTETINWLGRLSDYSKSAGADVITAQFYNVLTNWNPLFQRTVKFETEFYRKEGDTLWDLAGDFSAGDYDNEMLDDILAHKVDSRVDDVLFGTKTPVTQEDKWINGTGYQYSLLDDTVVVSVPDFVPGGGEFDLRTVLYENFSEVQDFARQSNVSRILFDVSTNGGGFVVSTFALQWYVVPNADDICFPIVRHMTDNWISWVSSFGVNYNQTIDNFFSENADKVGDPAFIHERFQQLYLLLNYADQLLSDAETTQDSRVENTEVPRLKKIEEGILSQSSPAQRARLFNIFLKERLFLNASTAVGSELAPQYGWYLFDNEELINPKTREPFDPPLSQFTNYRVLPWGKPSNYSATSVFGFCYDILQNVSSLAGPSYDAEYWTEVAFVTDGNCGSACSLFTQTLQLTGAATAFTFGGLKDQAMDVASFGGGNVLEYDDTSPLLNIASHLGYWATFGDSDWSKRHTNIWVNKPIPFPNSARVRYTWNLGSASQLGPQSLPRQFYIIPPHKQLNMWARNLDERAAIHEEIVSIKNWTHLRMNPQFPNLGDCPVYHKA
ncbi:hypothetical protein FOZ62_022592 [Perkinsus olseni]|uniref:Tail specific protease domain-containing protein n=1 Tax=Perkinsus olseni TaxID=32597 RepID=A0A7J6SPG6_PEROL|nr:hypothetical protein FOZ62_022592 [Perkinsus olseni]